MTRVLHVGNYGVYVGDERGERHHSPHAHIKHRGQRIASIHLMSLTMLKQIAPVPAQVLQAIRENQDRLLVEWERLNS